MGNTFTTFAKMLIEVCNTQLAKLIEFKYSYFWNTLFGIFYHYLKNLRIVDSKSFFINNKFPKIILLGIVVFLKITISMNAQISGKVFMDKNGNGVRDSSTFFVDQYLQGITITAFPISGSIQTTTSSVNGIYSFSGLTLPVRIEFSSFGNGIFSGPQTSNNSSSVQFYSSNSSNANFGLVNPEFYCQENPPVAVAFTPGTSNFFTTLTSPSGIRNYSLSGLTTATNEFPTTVTIMPSSEVASRAQVGK